MNEAAIERTAGIIDRMDSILRSKLTKKQCFENIYIAKQIQRRQQGDSFTLEDHIRAMIYAMMSSDIPWKRLEGEIDENTARIKHWMKSSAATTPISYHLPTLINCWRRCSPGVGGAYAGRSRWKRSMITFKS